MNTANEISDRDLILVRLRFLDLLKSFFQEEEPDAERMSRWRGIFAALSRERINPSLDAAVGDLGRFLEENDLQQLKKEHYTLFIDPYSRHQLPLNGSYYLDGKSFGPSLAAYRELLKTAQLIKNRDITDPEDALPMMLDTLATLVEEEKIGSEKSVSLQEQLITRFLLPAAGSICAAAEKNPEADFYQHCTRFLVAYLELETGLFEPAEVRQ